MKICTKCLQEKDKSSFYSCWNNQRNKYYYRSMCKECDKASSRNRHYGSKEKNNERSREWHLANKKYANVKRRAAYHAEPDNEKRRKRQKHYKENKTLYLHHSKLRKSAIKNAAAKWRNDDYIKDLYRNCREAEEIFNAVGVNVKFHVDHIIPLNHDKVCGLHVENNLQILNAEENLSKSNSFEVI